MDENKTIGTLLKNAREDSGLTLNQISTKTKINLNILRSLENDDIDKLPNITYVKGFVKNYAKTVKLDAKLATRALEQAYLVEDEIIAKEAEVSSTHQPHVIEPNLETKSDTDVQVEEIKQGLIVFIQNLFKKKVLFAITALIIFVLILKLIVSWFSQLSNEPVVQPVKKEVISIIETENKEILPPTTEVPVIEKTIISPTENENKETASVVEIKEIETIKPVVEIKREETTEPIQKTEVSEPEVEKKPEVSSDGKFPYKNFRPAPKKLFTLIEDSPETKDSKLLPISVKAAVEQGKQNVYLVANTGDSWISYKVDDNPIKRYVLKQGRRLFIKGDRVLLFVGNYNETKVFYNNKYVSAQTSSGVKSLIFPPEAAKDLVLPLFPSYKGIPYEASEYMKNMNDKE